MSTKRNIPPPIPPAPQARLDARKRAELKAEEQAKLMAQKAGQSQTKDQTEGHISRSETGGPQGLEPTRYGDWEKSGRCIDF